MSTPTDAPDFVGKGWSYPPTFLPAASTLTVTSANEDIQRSLEILLGTRLGERVMLPEYGCNMEDLLFEPIDTALQTLLFDRVKTAILFYEPRIEVERMNLQNDRTTEGVILLEILYRVRSTNSRFNFVYPFYKNEGVTIPTPR
jgi:phage baseplate assembly protein W